MLQKLREGWYPDGGGSRRDQGEADRAEQTKAAGRRRLSQPGEPSRLELRAGKCAARGLGGGVACAEGGDQKETPGSKSNAGKRVD
ncbi:MAG: hypothetical protein ACLR4Z_01350 [Butyricicoccaceae bacterium]